MDTVAPPATTVVSPPVSAVSWPAIFGGAVAATAATIVLLLIGAGLGFASLSPWPNSGASATTFTVIGGIWLIVVQWLSAGVGGYITGRLRTPWIRYHSNEVFFRDTANGFLMWAVATLITVMIVASSVTSMVSGGASAVSNIAAGAAQGASQGAASNPATPSSITSSIEYGVDRLFRPATPAPAPAAGDPAAAAQTRTEATRILTNALAAGELPPADRTYLAQLIAARTGIPQADAERRIDDMVTAAKNTATEVRDAADKARKAASGVAFFTALSMLIGAFVASAAAAYGGSNRDDPN